MKKLIVLAVLLSVGSLLASAAFAYDKDPKGGLRAQDPSISRR